MISWTPTPSPLTKMSIAGGVAVVAGGLVAAITGPTDWTHGSWVAAFLVLVAGVAQLAVAAVQTQLAHAAPTRAFAAAEFGLWNASCAIVIIGTLLAEPTVATLGSALFAASLAMSIVAIRGSAGRSPLLLASYRAVMIVLLVSIPIGIALSWVRR